MREGVNQLNNQQYTQYVSDSSINGLDYDSTNATNYSPNDGLDYDLPASVLNTPNWFFAPDGSFPECPEIDSWETEEDYLDELSSPDLKIYVPEPFIASPSFIFEDLWFIHILHFAHWLWFMFISLIMFYFITFVNVVRWCNPRNQPKRETRGVSRSKCADIITACVPVSWAIAIIISETVDATDYYDGFGTGEIVVGIRAYQWGWEYFYPKGNNLNYTLNPSTSSQIGNSLKYSNSSDRTANTNVLWKYLQSTQNRKKSSSPAHLLVTNQENSKALNFFNFSEIGSNTLREQEAFQRIQFASKTNKGNLFNSKSDFEASYSKILSFYEGDHSAQDALTYGSLRQHNLTSLNASNQNFSNMLEMKTLNRFLAQSTNRNLADTSTSQSNLNKHTTIVTEKPESNEKTRLYMSLRNRNLKLNSLPVITDAKLPVNPQNKLLSSKKIKKVTSLNPTLHLGSEFINLRETKTLLNNFNSRSRNISLNLKSTNTQWLPAERNLRLFTNTSLHKTLKDLASSGSKTQTQPQLNLLDLHSKVNTRWLDITRLSKLLNSPDTAPSSHSPLTSTRPGHRSTDFNKFELRGALTTPAMMTVKEELAGSHTFNSYWNTLWSQTSQSARKSNLISKSNVFSKFYLPTPTEYAEYDFRSWQTTELLEDLFWESAFSSYTQDDLINSLEDLNDFQFFHKQENIFNSEHRCAKVFGLRKNSLMGPLLSKKVLSDSLNPTSPFTEETVVNPHLLNLSNYNIFSNGPTFDGLEDPYETVKGSNYFLNTNLRNTLTFNLGALSPNSYANVIDSFRADFEEQSQGLNAVNYLSADYLPFKNLSPLAGSRLTNELHLRSNTKNSLITYNAIQKVFKSRFDENRSNAKLVDFSESKVKHPLLTDNRVPYEALLGKNKESFFTPTLFNKEIKSLLNESSKSLTGRSTYFAGIPFLLSMKSDASRYLWFDWQAQWSSLEVQPSSISRYSLLGAPYANKSFEYSSAFSEELSDSEDYLTKLAKARKNYLSNWSYTPYLYARLSNWYKTNLTFQHLYDDSNLKSFKVVIKLLKFRWKSNELSGNKSTLFTSASADFNTPGRSSWKPQTGPAGVTYRLTTLSSLLAKREHFYRRVYHAKGLAPQLPQILVSGFKNPLLSEVRKSLPINDPINVASESSRQFFYQNTNFLKLLVLKEYLSILSRSKNSSLDYTITNSWILRHFFELHDLKSTANTSLLKNQYRPMRKGISNMVRLQATGAIALPVEIRLHILASSKDVIHSWAIPAAGVKIDCVPGYSSHRVTIFLLSGIFYGQCMEICGRYHHWMPIVAYFVKVDIFLLWCFHHTNLNHNKPGGNRASNLLTSAPRPASL